MFWVAPGVGSHVEGANWKASGRIKPMDLYQDSLAGSN
jgi:hypothetical protein